MKRSPGRRAHTPGRLTHLDWKGQARMVDVSGKPPTLREAVAGGSIRMSREAWRAVRSGRGGKGDALALARVAGIAAAKKTSELIPLCHAISLEHVGVEIRPRKDGMSVDVEATARARWSTGVEMEALVAAATALLTLYDMLKAVDRGMTIESVRLLRKSGGRSGVYTRS